MLLKTHIAIGIFAILFFVQHVSYKVSFAIILLVASILPDVDSGFSTLGSRPLFKPIQLLTKHRGIIHSFTFCAALSFIFAWYFPVIALPFFLGYSLHLLADSITLDGIRPFWPMKTESRGKIRVGGAVEDSVFVAFCIVDVVLLLVLFF